MSVSLVSAIALLVDPRTLLGEPVWIKPLKFGVAVATYSVTLAWLLSLLRRGRRVGWWLGSVFAAAGLLDVVAVVLAASHGTFSHYNDGTDPIAVAVDVLFGVGVAPLLLTTLGIAIVLLTQRHLDRALAIALRAGLALAAASMVTAGILSSVAGPRVVQDATGREIHVSGGHGIGDPDGNGMLLTGWSTTGGDLRVPHFVGMHGIQILLVVLLALILLARRFAPLRDEKRRARLIGGFALGYAGVFTVLVWQAARGQSLIAPDGLTAVVTITWVTLCAAALTAILLSGTRRRSV